MTSQSTAEGVLRPIAATPDELEKVKQVLEVLAGACDDSQALAALRRNRGDPEKTVSALLDELSGNPPAEPENDFRGLREAAAAIVQPRSPPPSRPERPEPIDLTVDDDEELQKAMAASLQDVDMNFQPTTAPDPNWAVVPANKAIGPFDGISQDDQAMNQAIEASLQDELSSDQFDEKPLEERLRRGHTPVALRVYDPTRIYAAMVIHALYFVPQIRRAISIYLPMSTPEELGEVSMDEEIPIRPPTGDDGGPAFITWSLLETFVNMELSRMSDLSADKLVSALRVEPWSRPQERVGDLTFDFYDRVALAVESELHGSLATDPLNPGWPRLFHFRHGPSNREPMPAVFHKQRDSSIAKVVISGIPDQNDLISSLANELREISSDRAQPEVIVHASEVVAFQLIHTSSASDRQKFRFPAYFYLDQFMADKAALAHEKRQVQHRLLEDVVTLEAKKKVLTKFQNRDVLADLQSAAYYHESIADNDGNEQRRATLQDTAGKLRKIIARIESEIEYIDTNVAKYKAEAEQILDCPGLQDYKYELRAVLMHDGIYGRNHLYSYVKYRGGWWKTVEHTITEVTEQEVLEDSTGLHWNAGPFLLIYSRAETPEADEVRLPWPPKLKNDVKENNQTFFEQLGPEVVAGVEDPNSPPTELPPLPTPTDASSMVVEPPSRGDPMELDP